jgi:type II secretory pathway pseudopilin PulG
MVRHLLFRRIVKTSAGRKQRARMAFGLMESMLGIVVMGIVFVALYSGMAMGFQSVRSARENLRATQILLEKFETLRLYNWEQVNTTNYIPLKFTNHYVLHPQRAGTTYYGEVTIAEAPLAASEPYREDMRAVTINLSWKSGEATRTRSFTSFVARYGIQHYVY